MNKKWDIPTSNWEENKENRLEVRFPSWDIKH